MEKFIKPLIEVVELKEDIICTSEHTSTEEDPTEIVDE